MEAALSPPWHSTFNITALLERASHLRNIQCTCDLSQEPKIGLSNWAIFLSFDDNVEWVFRSPKIEDGSISLETAGDLLESEVATMKYIKSNTSIPVPEVFDYSSTISNTIGIPFIFMSKASGTQLLEFDWLPHQLEKNISRLNQRPHLNHTNLEKVMRQLGSIASQLLNLRFNKIGSLFEEAGEYRVGKCLSSTFTFDNRDALRDGIIQGPFENENDYYDSLLSMFYRHIQEIWQICCDFFAPRPLLEDYETLQSYLFADNHYRDYLCVGTTTMNWKNKVNYCTAGHFLRQMIPHIGRESFANLADLGSGFPLYHPDLSAGNIFVDDNMNITCIIDWTFSSSVPISISLKTPFLAYPIDNSFPSLEMAFRSGFIDQYFHGRKISFISELWEYTHRALLFSQLVLLRSNQDYYYLKELYTSVYEQEDVSISSLFKRAQKEEKDLVELNMKYAKVHCDDEEWVSDMLEREENYFADVGKEEYPDAELRKIKLIGTERRAVARKIQVASELSQNFVADKRLWRWIEEMRRDLAVVEDFTDTSEPA